MTAPFRIGLPLLLALGLLVGAGCAPAAPSATRAPAANGSADAAPAAPAAQAPGAPASAPAALVPIRVAYSQVAAAFAHVWIAQDHGLFKKYGLDAEVVNLAKPV